MRLVQRMLLMAVCLGWCQSVMAEDTIDFNQQIRPLLATKCVACHGPDEEHREADLRLDKIEASIKHGAILPGKPIESEVIRRIESNDPDERMPPPSSKLSLTPEQKTLLRNWINQGAKHDEHWAFKPLKQPEVPAVKSEQLRSWVTNPIDHFVLRKLASENLSPSPEADEHALIRRVYLDLIGLPPTPEEADAFAKSTDPKAYEKLVDQLLKSERYGERWARQWLDLARYADTNGYEKDRPRSIWPYRDWVIRALNNDMPYDQFTIEQLAGDMLPNPTQDQLIATGFHRNTMLNEEGGIDPLEYRFHAMVDRVATTGTIWLGLSTGCAQCHTHKYDPITHTDYYRIFGLLNNADEPDLSVKSESLLAKQKSIDERVQSMQAKLPEKFPPDEKPGTEQERRLRSFETHFQNWMAIAKQEAVPWNVIRPTNLDSNLPKLEVLQDGSIFSSGDITKRDVFRLTFKLDESQLPITAIRLEALPDARLPAGGPGRAFYEGRKGDFFLSELKAIADGLGVKFSGASQNYGKLSIGGGKSTAMNVLDGNGSTGWSTSGREGESHQLVLNLEKPIVNARKLEIELLFERHFAASLGRFRLSVTSSDKDVSAKQLPVEMEEKLAKLRESNASSLKELREYFAWTTPILAEARKPIEKLKRQRPTFPTTLVFEERPDDNPRTTHRYHRGEFLNPREVVAPGLPEFLLKASAPKPKNRLEFARWLVSEKNPLAARVAVNRAWQSFFGIGLVDTSSDFGTQGSPPSHPELLDWLASDFIKNGWSMKQLHRTIVLSSTYRQSSRTDEKLTKRDPANRLLARGPRVRMPAEMIRDAMLTASGLLSTKMYGPGVYPPQPASVTALAYGNTNWKPSLGEDRYRRSLYTFAKRTAPFAAYTVFDGPTGESCIAKRDRSNTPLQALTLLNDTMYLEMAQALAKSSISETPTTDEKNSEIATTMFRRVLTRIPNENEVQKILSFHKTQQKRLENKELDVTKIVGQKSNADASFAAWVMTARAIMNLDEAIVKP